MIKVAEVTLFADNFDRLVNADLNDSTDGKAGTLGALDWIQQGVGGGMEISDNRLKAGDNAAGAGWAMA